jgi:hypothetical protein
LKPVNPRQHGANPDRAEDASGYWSYELVGEVARGDRVLHWQSGGGQPGTGLVVRRD